MRARLPILLLTGTALAATLGALVGTTLHKTGTTDPIALLHPCTTVATADAATTCVTDAVRTMGDIPVGVITNAVADAFRNNAALRCHDMMHALGHAVVPRMSGDTDTRLGERWSECGYGLLHGLFENLELPQNDPGATAFTSCDRPEFHGNLQLTGNCFHAIGHSLHAHTSWSTEPAARQCVQGAKDTRLGEEAVSACLSGVYMSDHDRRFAPDTTISPENVEDAYRYCVGATGSSICSSYFATSVNSGTATLRAHILFCSGLNETPLICLRQAAMSLSLSILAGRAGDPAACTDGVAGIEGWGPDSKNVIAACVAGATAGAQSFGLTGAAAEQAAREMMSATNDLDGGPATP